MQAKTDIRERAAEARGWFELRRHGIDGERHPYWSARADAPDDARSLALAVHDDGAILPDDFRYAALVSALDAIAESEDGDDLDEIGWDWADGEVDVYTSGLIAWAGSHGSRPGYVDQAAHEYGAFDSLFTALQRGQFEELREVYAAVRGWLEQD